MKTNKERVRDAYQKSGLTYDELATITGLKRNSLACWITGRRTPNDVITNLIEEKVANYINSGGEYINKTAYRDDFVKEVRCILPKETADKIIQTFDSLPTVSINFLRKK